MNVDLNSICPKLAIEPAAAIHQKHLLKACKGKKSNVFALFLDHA